MLIPQATSPQGVRVGSGMLEVATGRPLQSCYNVKCSMQAAMRATIVLVSSIGSKSDQHDDLQTGDVFVCRFSVSLPRDCLGCDACARSIARTAVIRALGYRFYYR